MWRIRVIYPAKKGRRNCQIRSKDSFKMWTNIQRSENFFGLWHFSFDISVVTFRLRHTGSDVSFATYRLQRIGCDITVATYRLRHTGCNVSFAKFMCREKLFYESRWRIVVVSCWRVVGLIMTADVLSKPTKIQFNRKVKLVKNPIHTFSSLEIKKDQNRIKRPFE